MDRVASLDTSLASFYAWAKTNLVERRKRLTRSPFFGYDTKPFPLTGMCVEILTTMDMGGGGMRFQNVSPAGVSYASTDGFAEAYDADTRVHIVEWTNVAVDTPLLTGGPLRAYWRFLHHVRNELGVKKFVAAVTQEDYHRYVMKMFIIHSIFFNTTIMGVSGFPHMTSAVFADVRKWLIEEQGAVSCEIADDCVDDITGIQLYFDQALYDKMKKIRAEGGTIIWTRKGAGPPE